MSTSTRGKNKFRLMLLSEMSSAASDTCMRALERETQSRNISDCVLGCRFPLYHKVHLCGIAARIPVADLTYVFDAELSHEK